jgi:hypothetical protein
VCERINGFKTKSKNRNIRGINDFKKVCKSSNDCKGYELWSVCSIPQFEFVEELLLWGTE